MKWEREAENKTILSFKILLNADGLFNSLSLSLSLSLYFFYILQLNESRQRATNLKKYNKKDETELRAKNMCVCSNMIGSNPQLQSISKPIHNNPNPESVFQKTAFKLNICCPISWHWVDCFLCRLSSRMHFIWNKQSQRRSKRKKEKARVKTTKLTSKNNIKNRKKRRF